ncbi:MAG: glycosyltransferase family 4 protein [Vicinamibacterales bacterium]
MNYTFDSRIETPEALLDCYDTLSGWCDAVSQEGLSVRLVQAFKRDAVLLRDAAEWHFCEAPPPRARWVRHMHQCAAAHNPDVVHVNGFDALVQTWLLRRAMPDSTAIVVQDHAGVPSGNWIKSRVRRALMREIDGFLFTSRAQADPWVQGGFITSDHVYDVLEASTSLRPMDRADARRSTGVDGSPALLWVARLDSNKDPLTILEGFEYVVDVLPRATLTMIYRDAELLPLIQQRLQSSRALGERVRLVGAVPHAELATWYSAADLFVIGSAREVCGYAVVEACACGAIPIVTDIPPFRAITGDGAIGRHWPRGDARSFADAVIAVSESSLDRDRPRVLEHFANRLSWDAVGQRACAVYETVAARRRSERRVF